MELEFDRAKSGRNLRERGLTFERARELLEGDPIVIEDARRDYHERRLIAYGNIAGRLHVCVFTMRGTAFRIISLRRASRREINALGQNDLRRGTQTGAEGAR
jgi:uncharacterized DUF497 family protein